VKRGLGGKRKRVSRLEEKGKEGEWGGGEGVMNEGEGEGEGGGKYGGARMSGGKRMRKKRTFSGGKPEAC